MFTGIVQGTAVVEAVSENGGIRSIVLRFAPGFCEDLQVGASVSVNGVCLTATSIMDAVRSTFDVVVQSLAVTTIDDIELGESVNVERAAKEGAENGGHILSGHVDFKTPILEVVEIESNKRVRFQLPEDFRGYIFRKGYVAIDGCSLTVSDCDKRAGWFEVWLIPETRRVTIMDGKAEGAYVNIEIERQTQVIVDTVRDTVDRALGSLQPLLYSILEQRGVLLEDLLRLPSFREAPAETAKLPASISSNISTEDLDRE